MIAGWLDRIFLSTWQRRSNLVARCLSRPAGADTRRRLNPVNLSPVQVNPEKQALDSRLANFNFQSWPPGPGLPSNRA